MSNYVTEQIQAGGNDLTVLYPAVIPGREDAPVQALTGVVMPPLENQYPFKVKVVKTSSQKRFHVTLQRKNEDNGQYIDDVTFTRFTKRGAMRKANKVLRRAINERGVL